MKTLFIATCASLAMLGGHQAALADPYAMLAGDRAAKAQGTV